MHRNPLWLIFLGIITVATLFFAGRAGKDLWAFSRLTASTSVTSLTFTPHPRSCDVYIPKADYSFQVRDKNYVGSTLLFEPAEPTADALTKSLPRLEKESWKVTFDPNDPNHSTIDKHFPFKSTFYGTVMMGIFIYLWGIGLRVKSP